MTPKKSRGGFFVPRPEDVRRLQLEIYRATAPKPEEKLYQEYFGSDVPDERGGRYYSDVDEYLEERGITETQALEIVESDHQSIVIGIPTYDHVCNRAEKIHYLEEVHDDIKIMKKRHQRWPVEMVINVNGLDAFRNPQRQYLGCVLEFQRSHSTDEAPITVIHMPLGGRLDAERLSGKSNAVNPIAEYAKDRGATIIGIMDDDIQFAEGNILSNVEFLISKARCLRSLVLTGSSSQSLVPLSRWGKWMDSHKASGPHDVRGGSMFSFLVSFPPLPSFPVSEDLYLKSYFAESSGSYRNVQRRIHCNPGAMIYFKAVDTFVSSCRHKYNYGLQDEWLFSILGNAKKSFRIPRSGFRMIRAYITSNYEQGDKSKTIANFKKSLPEFLFRKLLINQLVKFTLWVRQRLDLPLYTTYWPAD